MERLVIRDVTYLGGSTGPTGRPVQGLRLVLGGSAVAVRGPVRRLLSVPWRALDWLYALTLDDVERKGRGWRFEFSMFPNFGHARAAGPDGSILGLGSGDTTTWLLVERLSVAELREHLASWALATHRAGGLRPGASELRDPGDPDVSALDVTRRVWDSVKAARLADEPPRDRAVVSQRLSLAEQYRTRGDLDGALLLLGPLADQSVEVFGPADAATIAVRNNLAYALAAAGHRGEAIAGYWGILDDLAAADVLSNPAEMFARQNLARLHDPNGRL
ncbi:hypothetical protein ACFWUQ_27675 [Streptomyces sp. NPDC058662]|uniref:hypothetical protein n=1 Tax=Streptomyces sp. NPDC058662 TaxID=3346583 RepID=UPI0036626EAE